MKASKYLTHDEYILNLNRLNHPDQLVNLCGDGCFSMYCNAKLLETKRELENIKETDNNKFEVRFTPFKQLKIKKNQHAFFIT